jgi:hypothetical protein
MRDTRIIKSTSSISPEEARKLRAHAWAFIFDCHAKKKAAHPGGPDDAKEFKNDRTARKNYTD